MAVDVRVVRETCSMVMVRDNGSTREPFNAAAVVGRRGFEASGLAALAGRGSTDATAGVLQSMFTQDQ